MPNWDGIEDFAATPHRVWLSRVKETDPWKPLRKADSWALNQTKESTVFIEGGLATADKENGVIKTNFHRAPDRILTSAVWFVRKDPNSKDKETNLEPICGCEEDSQKIEALYQSAIEATSSYGRGIDSVLKEEVELEDNSKVMVVRSNGGTVLSIKKKPPGWLSHSQDLQRGYGGYTVEGEDNELLLGPLRHVMFVVHGIGESIWSREDSSNVSLIDEVNRMRLSIQKLQIDQWLKQCEKAKKAGEAVPPKPDRIEFIPIEWYDRLHSSSNDLSKSLQAVTLPTIPALRSIANEAVFDVLLYITPAFCEPILDCVTSQITTAYERFLEVHPTFLSDGGKCHLIGHSLGSVILWDLLSILKDSTEEPVPKQKSGDGDEAKESSGGGVAYTSDDKANKGYQAYADANANTAQNGTWGPTLPKRFEKTIPFLPENAVFLGSPIGMFLTLRGAHPVFDEFRKKRAEQILIDFEETGKTKSIKYEGEKDEYEGEKDKIAPSDVLAALDVSKKEKPSPELPFASPFTLPVSGGIYNIFHPSDPVAYRIEPLLLPPDMKADEIPAPIHLTVQGQGVRLHIKAQQLGDEIAKAMEGKRASFASFVTHAVSVLGKSVETAVTAQKKRAHSTGPEVFPLGGRSERVDFQLQRGVVDNEYISSVTAHSAYFVNTDVLDFVISLTAEKTKPSDETPDII